MDIILYIFLALQGLIIIGAVIYRVVVRLILKSFTKAQKNMFDKFDKF